MDAKRGDVEKALGESTGKYNLSENAADLAVGMGAFASGNSGLGAMGVALWFLPTGQSKSPKELPQIAAWVPASAAPNFQAAAKLAHAEWEEARRAVFTKYRTQLLAYPAALPYGNSDNHSTFSEAALEIPFPLMKQVNAKPRPDFLPAGSYYGPIFLLGAPGQVVVDEKEN